MQKMLDAIKAWWGRFSEKHPTLAQFIMFFIVCNGVTVLQMLMLMFFKWVFNMTPLVDINFQIFNIGKNFDGSLYYMFDYAAGALGTAGGGGGLAYFLAMQITLAIAQVINFFAQRNITFKAKNNVWYAAMWYAIAYVIITFVSAAAQGFYKAPIYKLFIETWGMGSTLPDIITMLITSAISFWVFFPIMKFIFKDKSAKEVTETQETTN